MAYKEKNARFPDSKVYLNGAINPDQMKDYTDNLDMSSVTKHETKLVQYIEKISRVLQEMSADFK